MRIKVGHVTKHQIEMALSGTDMTDTEATFHWHDEWRDKGFTHPVLEAPQATIQITTDEDRQAVEGAIVEIRRMLDQMVRTGHARSASQIDKMLRRIEEALAA